MTHWTDRKRNYDLGQLSGSVIAALNVLEEALMATEQLAVVSKVTSHFPQLKHYPDWSLIWNLFILITKLISSIINPG